MRQVNLIPVIPAHSRSLLSRYLSCWKKLCHRYGWSAQKGNLPREGIKYTPDHLPRRDRRQAW
ncbi:hypothetical protein E2C01_047623 [Portunus trituberculatus]|uniref:Uncharacterized protein n=1 Tax=Portunus trituberculatus TaxID=210409 RepID=A0A5B7GB12_PORTR|nr:hypothetical protein [Portunus trituberculatus]